MIAGNAHSRVTLKVAVDTTMAMVVIYNLTTLGPRNACKREDWFSSYHAGSDVGYL